MNRSITTTLVKRTAAVVLFSTLAISQVWAADKALILGPTVTGGLSSIEAQEAIALGLTVEIATEAAWAAKTTADFAGYRVIILGDPTCSGLGPANAAQATTSIWSPAITGNVIVNGTDPVFHASQGGAVVTRKGVDFAAAQVGKTGL